MVRGTLDANNALSALRLSVVVVNLSIVNLRALRYLLLPRDGHFSGAMAESW